MTLTRPEVIVECFRGAKLMREAPICKSVQLDGPWNFNVGLLEIAVGNVRILVVEDEFLIRLMLSEVLSDEGFDITEAATGDQAIQLLDQCGTFDLLLTDISMPGQADGNAVAMKAKQLNPAIPVLYASGRPESLVNKVETCDAFMCKPYGLADMVVVVRELLSQSEKRASYAR